MNVIGNTFTGNVTNTLGGAGLVNVNSANNNFLDGILSDGAGTLALTQSGGGTTTLRAANTYTGPTLVSAGHLCVSTAGTASSAGSFRPRDPATVNG